MDVVPDLGSISATWLLLYTAIALFIINQVRTLTHFWRRGIRGPTPFPLIGNYPSFLSGFVPALEKWEKKYGNLYGIFGGRQPVLVVSDPDLARLILIKDFTSFHSRKESEFKMKYISDSLPGLDGEQWKRTRRYISPAFSASKMKRMVPSIVNICDSMLAVLQKKSETGEAFETKPVFGAYVLDVVASCAFGINTECQNNPDEPFVKHTNALFNIKLTHPVVLMMMFAPFMAPLANLFEVSFVPKESLEFFADIVRKAVELRRKEGGRTETKDFLQLMMEAAEIATDEDEKEAKKEYKSQSETSGEKSSRKIPLTNDDLMAQSMVFFFAGYETVSSTLSFVAYAIATNREVQKKLQAEIDEMVTGEEPISYDTVFNMEYLDKVWCEGMRRYTINTVLKRCCTEDFTYKGIRIARGEMIYVNAHAIHLNPEYWPDPLTFDPERFSKKARETHHPCAYLPFGAGPRNCVGMRFATLEAKIGLIRILQRFNLETMAETDNLDDTSNWGKSTIYPAKGIHLKVTSRT